MAPASPRSARRAAPAAPCLALLAALLLPAPAEVAGQELQTGHLLAPLVPAGHLRLGFQPGFTSWDSRFGTRTVDGTTVDGEEPLATDLTSATGTDLFPGVATLRANLEALTETPLPTFTLGQTRGSVTQNVTRLDFQAHVGVFDWLTVGGTVPWVKTRSAIELLFDADPEANLGLTPTASANEAVNAYVQGLLDAAAQAATRAEAACAPGGSGCEAAQALAARVEDFSFRAQRMYFTSPLFPLTGSEAAAAFAAANEALAADLAAAGIGAPGTPVFATEAVDGETFGTLPTLTAAGIAGRALESRDGLWRLGDVEVEATLRLLEGEVRDSGAAAPRLAWTVAAGGLVRLPTGTVDSVDVFLDLGSGDGQVDVEGFGYGALRVGSRLDLRAMGRFGIQRSRTLLRRVAPHEAVFPGVSSRRAVEWSPGAYLDLLVSPRVRVTEALALAADYRLYTKGEDDYALVGGAGDATDPDVGLLERETEVTAHQIAVGLRYSTLGLWRRGETGSPVELSARLVRTVAGSGGRTPASTRAELALRLFRRIWGG